MSLQYLFAVLGANSSISTFGNLYTWGLNNNGQLGNNTSTNTSSPATTVGGGTTWTQVSCGYVHTAAIKNDGTLWTWGFNDGRLGQGTVLAPESSPVTVSGGITIWKQVSCGQYHTMAIRTDGTMWGTGTNTNGQLGIGTNAATSTFTQNIGTGSTWSSVAAGAQFNLALKSDNSLWSCGYNLRGQIGDNTVTTRSSFVSVVGGNTWAGIACGYAHSAAIDTSGRLWTWGYNNFGQLGDNTSSNRSSPVTVSGGGTTWKQVACGYAHTMAVKTDGTMWGFGLGTAGQIGNGGTNTSSPVTVLGGGTTWKQVASGLRHTVALKTDGTMWTFGQDTYGQLGNNGTTLQTSPVSVVGGITWKTTTTGSMYGNATAGIA